MGLKNDRLTYPHIMRGRKSNPRARQPASDSPLKSPFRGHSATGCSPVGLTPAIREENSHVPFPDRRSRRRRARVADFGHGCSCGHDPTCRRGFDLDPGGRNCGRSTLATASSLAAPPSLAASPLAAPLFLGPRLLARSLGRSALLVRAGVPSVLALAARPDTADGGRALSAGPPAEPF